VPVECPEGKITWKMLNETCEMAPWLYTGPMSHPTLKVALAASCGHGSNLLLVHGL